MACVLRCVAIALRQLLPHRCGLWPGCSGALQNWQPGAHQEQPGQLLQAARKAQCLCSLGLNFCLFSSILALHGDLWLSLAEGVLLPRFLSRDQRERWGASLVWGRGSLTLTHSRVCLASRSPPYFRELISCSALHLAVDSHSELEPSNQDWLTLYAWQTNSESQCKTLAQAFADDILLQLSPLFLLDVLL